MRGGALAKRVPSSLPQADSLEQIKKLVIIAMFSDDDLLERLVLKGGNALDLVHRISKRASIDVDFSMSGDFPREQRDTVQGRVEALLGRTFREAGYYVFDVRMDEQPEDISPDVADFWGGWRVEFKLIHHAAYATHAGDINALRRHALRIGQGQKFLIDISRYELTIGKQPDLLDGFRIYVYSREMLLCEKLRAICQQMPDYGPIVKRRRPGAARARDFLDIHTLVVDGRLDVATPQIRRLLSDVFRAKRVPLTFLRRIATYREFHRADFPAVQATVKPGIALQPYDDYFDFVLSLVDRLEPLGDE